MNVHHQRAALLVAQSRHEEAVRELQQAIQEEPDNALHYGLLANALNHLDRHHQASEAAAKMLELAPNDGCSHYVRATIYLSRGNFKEARESMLTALALEPEDADNFALLAKSEYGLQNWQQSLEAANRGLEFDPAEDACLHWRSLALTKLGRRDEAEETLKVLTSIDPNDPYTHQSHGWLCLERGDAAGARRHFLEALRQNPNDGDSRTGLVNALKARHQIFGRLLQFLLYFDRFRTGAIWFFIIALFVGLRLANQFALTHPQWFVAIWIAKSLLFTFFALVISAHSLFELVLRLDPEGRQALPPELIRASNWSGLCLVAALGMGALWAWKGDQQMGLLAWTTLLLLSAIRHTCLASEGWVRRRMTWVTIVAALCIPASFVLAVVGLLMIVKLHLHAGWLVRLSMFYLPVLSVAISGFSDDILGFLEKRKPDLIPPPRTHS
jgi:tetratricopeptide (TPR) repeat protein